MPSASMPSASDTARDQTKSRSGHDWSAAGETWGPTAYRSLAVLAFLLAGVSALIGADLPTSATQLWDSARVALAAALAVFVLVR